MNNYMPNTSKSNAANVFTLNAVWGSRLHSRIWIFALLVVATVLVSGGCDIVTNTTAPPGSYGPVLPEHLEGTNCSYLPKYHEFDFVWTFNNDSFSIEGKSIAPDLQEVLVGPDAEAELIEGTWSIDGGEIELVVVTSDGVEKPRKTKLPIYSTGVIRIETPSRQYVFAKN